MRKLDLPDGWHEFAPPGKIKEWSCFWFAAVIGGIVVAAEPLSKWNGKTPIEFERFCNKLENKKDAQFEERYLREQEALWGVRVEDLLVPIKHDWEDTLELL